MLLRCCAGGIFALYALICRGAGLRPGSSSQMHEADLGLGQYSLPGRRRRGTSTVAAKFRGKC